MWVPRGGEDGETQQNGECNKGHGFRLTGDLTGRYPGGLDQGYGVMASRDGEKITMTNKKSGRRIR